MLDDIESTRRDIKNKPSVASLNAERFDDNSLSSQSRLLLVRRDNFSSLWDFVCVARVFLNQH